MDKQIKALLNSLRCPVCGAQIDIAGMGISRAYNYCCAAYPPEYMLWVDDLLSVPKIRYDKVVIYDGSKKYITDQGYVANETVFDIWNVDAEGNVKDYNYKTVKLDYILFDYQKTDREKIVRRLKMVMVFG